MIFPCKSLKTLGYAKVRIILTSKASAVTYIFGLYKLLNNFISYILLFITNAECTDHIFIFPGYKLIVFLTMIDVTGIVVTNDGNAILRELDIAHPAAKVLLFLYMFFLFIFLNIYHLIVAH